MSIKSNGRRLGRMVRRITGLPLPVAMKIGKMVAQSKSDFEMMEKFPGIVALQKHYCECCGPQFILKGPRGSMQDWVISENSIARELRIIEAFKKVPVGTMVSV
jgi:hypothetical protein